MRILVYGAGVLGSVYAAHLLEGGHNVAVLARGKRLADIREHGIVLEELGGDSRMEARVSVVESLEPADAYELVLVIVRKTQVASVLPALAANSNTPNVVFLMNNAAGPDELVRSLGRDRVLMGFPGGGGVLQDHVVRYAVRGKGSHRLETTLGQLDGTTSPRLESIVVAFRQASVPVEVCSNIDAWLKSHVALVIPIVHALYRAGGDNYALARDSKTVRLMLRAVREGLRVVQGVGLPITPRHLELINWLPLWLWVPLLRKFLNTEFAEIALAGHARAARDEMKHLGDEFRALIKQTSVPTPAIDEMSAGRPPN
jgi:2-dehydropantoate 2-reductase